MKPKPLPLPTRPRYTKEDLIGRVIDLKPSCYLYDTWKSNNYIATIKNVRCFSKGDIRATISLSDSLGNLYSPSNGGYWHIGSLHENATLIPITFEELYYAAYKELDSLYPTDPSIPRKSNHTFSISPIIDLFFFLVGIALLIYSIL